MTARIKAVGGRADFLAECLEGRYGPEAAALARDDGYTGAAGLRAVHARLAAAYRAAAAAARAAELDDGPGAAR